jgi:copper homeostasis protein
VRLWPPAEHSYARESMVMSGLLEVVVLHPADAERAEAGGAQRLELTSSLTDGMSPAPALVGQVRRATRLPIRVLLRLRPGYGTDGAEVARLKGLLSSYREIGADGAVLGFLNGHTEVDTGVVTEIVGEYADLRWTFNRAVDACFSSNRAWRDLRVLPGLDQVLTAGSARGVSEGLDDLVARAAADEFARTVIMAGGGLQPEHVPWLARAGVRAFQIGVAARPLASAKAYVDPALVRSWRNLIDHACALSSLRAAPPASTSSASTAPLGGR